MKKQLITFAILFLCTTIQAQNYLFVENLDMFPQSAPNNQFSDSIRGISESIEFIFLVTPPVNEVPSILNSYNFPKLKQLILYARDAKEIPEDFLSFPKLQELTFRTDAALEKLPDVPISLPKIREIELIAPLKKFPDQFCTLQTLGVLKLLNANFQELPNAINQLKKLRYFSTDAPIKKLPAGFFELKNLKSLSLNNQTYTEIPIAIQQLKKLDYLKIEAPLESFSQGIYQLRKLRTLTIENGQFSQIPQDIQQLKKLDYLEIVAPLESFSQGICQLRKLRTLVIKNGQFSQIPQDIQQLKKLTFLNVEAPLEQFPAGILKLKKLKLLSFFDAKFTTVPDQINQLKKLKSLTISAPLKQFTQDLEELEKLESLRLSNTQLETFPTNILTLHNRLKELGFGSSQFQTLPKNINELKQLEELRIRGEQLKTVSLDLDSLTKLRQLWIVAPQLQKLEINSLDDQGKADRTSIEELTVQVSQGLKTSVQFLEDFSAVKELTLTGLHHEQLEDVSVFYGELESLTINNDSLSVLNLHWGRNLEALSISTKLSFFPKEISNSKSLRFITIHCPNLTQVPTKLLNIETLEIIFLGDHNLSPEALKKLQEACKAKDVRCVFKDE